MGVGGAARKWAKGMRDGMKFLGSIYEALVTGNIFLPEILAESVNVGDICVEGGIVVMQEADERIIAENDTNS